MNIHNSHNIPNSLISRDAKYAALTYTIPERYSSQWLLFSSGHLFPLPCRHHTVQLRNLTAVSLDFRKQLIKPEKDKKIYHGLAVFKGSDDFNAAVMKKVVGFPSCFIIVFMLLCYSTLYWLICRFAERHPFKKETKPSKLCFIKNVLNYRSILSTITKIAIFLKKSGYYIIITFILNESCYCWDHIRLKYVCKHVFIEKMLSFIQIWGKYLPCAFLLS